MQEPGNVLNLVKEKVNNDLLFIMGSFTLSQSFLSEGCWLLIVIAN